MNMTEKRHSARKTFIESGQNLIVGNLEDFPLTLEELKEIDENSIYVDGVITSGLTAIIYTINVGGNWYNLKKKREISKVQNKDGEYSFLNEVLRRNDFHHNQSELIQRHVVKTIYANYNEGIILSDWIYGERPKVFNYLQFLSLFKTLFEFEKNHLFEWDLCPGNILMENGVVKLFDFGYNYEFNPLKMFNSDGKDAPGFHMAERLETRCMMELWADIEEFYDEATLIENIKIEKAAAMIVYVEKLRWLEENNADPSVIEWQKSLIAELREYLRGPEELLELYQRDKKIYYLKDVEDDISGKSCTVQTIRKIDYLIDHSSSIEEKNKYNIYKESVIKYQL